MVEHWEKIEELAREATLPALGDLLILCGVDIEKGKFDFHAIRAGQKKYHDEYCAALLAVQGKDFIPY